MNGPEKGNSSLGIMIRAAAKRLLSLKHAMREKRCVMKLPGWALFIAGIVVMGYSLISQNKKLLFFIWLGLVVAIYGLIRMIFDFLSAQRERKQAPQTQYRPHQPTSEWVHAERNQQQHHAQHYQHPAGPVQQYAQHHPAAHQQFMMRPHPQQTSASIPMLCSCGGAYLRPTDNFCSACGRSARRTR